MADPAIRKVQDHLKGLIEAARPDLNVFIDRSDDEPLGEGDWPGAVIRVTDVRFSPFEQQGMTRVDAIIQIDCQSGFAGGETIDLINQTSIADIVAAVHADRTFGGRLQDCEETAASGSEASGADVGCAILEYAIIFFCPRGDLYTILGQGGASF
jgi:hypothetical protein